MAYLQVRANVAHRPRFGVMEGRDYIVLPVVLLTEGVHAGSNGPILYLTEDLERFASAWNHKPIVVFHPTRNGEFISADDPTVLTQSKVGILMHTQVNGNRLEAEAWLERERLKAVHPEVLDAIQRGIIVEVSTGLFMDLQESEGDWNGEFYVGIARNYRPDHLALLPGLVGACSVKDGCGLFTAAQSLSVNQAYELQKTLVSILDNKEISVIKPDEDTAVPTEPDSKGDLGMSTEVTTNCTCPKLKALVDGLIASNTGWKESDREWLMSQSEDILGRLVAMQNLTKEETKESRPEQTKVEEPQKVEEQVSNVDDLIKSKKELTVEEYIRQAPKPIQAVLARGLAAHQAERKRYMEIILSNETNQFTEEELKGFELSMLHKLAALAVQPPEKEPEQVDLFSFIGNAGAPPVTTHQEEHLPLPTINYRKQN